MKSLVGCLLAGLVSAFVALPARADGSGGSGNILIAPQLAVASDGPLTATLLGITQSQPFHAFTVQGATETPFATFTLFAGSSTPGAQAQIPAPSAGTSIVFAAGFVSQTLGVQTVVYSATATTNVNVIESFDNPLFNAGVIETGPDRVLIGFTPFASTPRGFGGFPVRIAVSNVCVR